MEPHFRRERDVMPVQAGIRCAAVVPYRAETDCRVLACAGTTNAQIGYSFTPQSRNTSSVCSPSRGARRRVSVEAAA